MCLVLEINIAFEEHVTRLAETREFHIHHLQGALPDVEPDLKTLATNSISSPSCILGKQAKPSRLICTACGFHKISKADQTLKGTNTHTTTKSENGVHTLKCCKPSAITRKSRSCTGIFLRNSCSCTGIFLRNYVRTNTSCDYQNCNRMKEAFHSGK